MLSRWWRPRPPGVAITDRATHVHLRPYTIHGGEKRWVVEIWNGPRMMGDKPFTDEGAARDHAKQEAAARGVKVTVST